MDEQTGKEKLLLDEILNTITHLLNDLNDRLIKLELLHKKSLSKQHGGVEM